MTPIFFPSAGALREWLGRHHATERELYIGFYRKGTGKQGLSYRDAVEESLAHGWIDGVVRRLDDERYVQRYTPRRPRSNWSLVNIRRVEELIRAGRMTPAGLAAFEAREEKRSGVYAYENRPTELSAEQQRVFRANPSAWRYFQDETPSYRRTVTWWVWSARREETRRRRLETLIADSAAGRRIRQLLAPARTAKARRPAKKRPRTRDDRMRRMRVFLSAALVATAACASQDDPVPASSGASGTAAPPPASVASPRDTASGTIGGASISVDYGRPSRRGREIFGSLVPFDAVWRTGANAATTLVVGAPVEIGGKPLDAGTYTLYSMPARTGWTLIVNGQTGQWGTEYRQDRDLFRVALTLARAPTPVDTFTITVEPGERDGAIVFAWDTLQGSVAVRAR